MEIPLGVLARISQRTARAISGHGLVILAHPRKLFRTLVYLNQSGTKTCYWWTGHVHGKCRRRSCARWAPRT